MSAVIMTTMRSYAITFVGILISVTALTPAFAKGTKNDKDKVSVIWATPAAGTIFIAPVNISLTVEAFAKQSNHPIIEVEFFNGDTLIGSKATPATGITYQLNWLNVPPGTYSLTAAATNDKDDYDQTAPVTITVVKGSQVISGFSPATPITYANNITFSLSASGGASGNTVTFASSSQTVCSVTGSVATILLAGSCTLTANQVGNTYYNAAPQATTTVTINKANQTISSFSPATPITYANGASFALSATGGASGNAISFASTSPSVCSVTGNTATLQTAGTCILTADQVGNINYHPATQATATVTINKANQGIAGFNPASPKTYAANATFALTATGGASGNAVTFASTAPTVCVVSGSIVTVQSAGACTLTADQAGDGNHNAAPQAVAAVTITKATQSITGFSPASLITYSSSGTFTLSATGGASNNPLAFASTTPAVCSVNGNTATVMSAGTCTLTADQMGNVNFQPALQVMAIVTITKANQSITGFTPTSPITYAANATFVLIANGGASGNQVTFASGTPAVCTVTGNTATVLTAGTCTLTADQMGNTNYNAAPQATSTVTINKANQTIAGFNPASPVIYSANATFALTASSTSGNPVTFASGTPSVCTVTGNIATVQTAGTCTLTADQAGDGNHHAAMQATAAVTITKVTQTITGFNPASPVTLALGDTFTLSATGGASGNAVTFGSVSTAVCVTGGTNGATVTVVSAGTCMLTANQAGNDNHSAAPTVSASVVIAVQAAVAQLYFIHADHLGTPRAITRPSDNKVVWKWKNDDAFGNNDANENPLGQGAFEYNLRFPGQYRDKETGTHYNYYRDFDASTGRYIQSDPIGLAGGLSTYGYALGNPTSFIDPYGLDVQVCFYGGAAGGFGHVGFGPPGGATRGFYFANDESAFGGKGEIQLDKQSPSQFDGCKVISADEKQDKCMDNCRKDRTTTPGTYHLTKRNCTMYTRDCLAKCGLPTGPTTGPAPEQFFLKLPGSLVPKK